MTCANGHTWVVPAVLAQGPTGRELNRAKRRTSVAHGGFLTRGRRITQYGIAADQAARAAQSRQCPACGLFAAEPGFYPDPHGQARERFWDGAGWTAAVR